MISFGNGDWGRLLSVGFLFHASGTVKLAKNWKSSTEGSPTGLKVASGFWGT